MGKQKKIRYVLLDLGEKAHVEDLFQDDQSALALEVHRENQCTPYSRYHVQRVLPCRVEHGKLYRL